MTNLSNVDLDKVENGDILVIEAAVVRSKFSNDIWLVGDHILLNGKANEEIKVLEHKPGPRLAEPKGIGAVVKGYWQDLTRYQWVRISVDGDRPWQTVGLPNAHYTFDVLLNACEDLEVVSEGVEF